MAQPEKKEIKIELTPEVAQGKYANLAVISHGPAEFFLDMICLTPNTPQGAEPHNHDSGECEAAYVCPSGQYQEI